MSSVSNEVWEREMTGKLFKYGAGGAHAAFASGILPSRKVAVHIGGLTDGLLPLPYTTALARMLENRGWALVQPLLSSSHLGYGLASLQKDSDEIDLLLAYLARKWNWDSEVKDKVHVIIIGHSTGCQDAIWHNKFGKEKHRVTGLVLQGPVSDREHAETNPAVMRLLPVARQLLSSEGREVLMPREADCYGTGAAITAYRFESLVGKLGDDDMFSSDLSDAQLADILGSVQVAASRLKEARQRQVPCLVAVSTEDEYVPPHVDKEVLGRRLAAAMPRGRTALVPGDHSVYREDGQAALLAAVESFVEDLEVGR